MTGTSIALSFTNGHRHFLSCLPNNESLRLEDLDLAGLDGCGHLHRADVWFSEAMLYGGNRRLFERARQAGMAISIDLNWDPKWGSAHGRGDRTSQGGDPAGAAAGQPRPRKHPRAERILGVFRSFRYPRASRRMGRASGGRPPRRRGSRLLCARDPDGGETGPGDAGGKHHGNRQRAQRVHDASPRARRLRSRTGCASPTRSSASSLRGSAPFSRRCRGPRENNLCDFPRRVARRESAANGVVCGSATPFVPQGVPPNLFKP